MKIFYRPLLVIQASVCQTCLPNKQQSFHPLRNLSSKLHHTLPSVVAMILQLPPTIPHIPHLLSLTHPHAPAESAQRSANLFSLLSSLLSVQLHMDFPYNHE